MPTGACATGIARALLLPQETVTGTTSDILSDPDPAASLPTSSLLLRIRNTAQRFRRANMATYSTEHASEHLSFSSLGATL